MELNSKIYVAGHKGMVGSAIVRNLSQNGYSNVITRSSTELDLTNQQSVNNFFASEKPEYVFLAAAKVGGIHANNTYRAEFIYNNLMIQANVMEAAYRNGVTKLLFLGSSCIYPKLAPQPLKEVYLLSGFLEPTNQSYAIAKIAGIEMCDAYRAQYGCNFISAMPTNLYGPNDNYDLENSHVLPALLRKIVTAKRNQLPTVSIWGSGTPRREFLHVDDLAEASVFLMKHYNEGGLVNVGCGADVSILELAQLIAKVVEYDGTIKTDATKPDGTPRKLLDVSKLHALGWQHRITLPNGIAQVYAELAGVDWQ
jgi:GDP-L-fucose synthase